MAFFSKTDVMIIFLQKLAVDWAKNANIFTKFFGENNLKNHNIGPRLGEGFRLLGTIVYFGQIFFSNLEK
jgi:hypothetical protein